MCAFFIPIRLPTELKNFQANVFEKKPHLSYPRFQKLNSSRLIDVPVSEKKTESGIYRIPN